MRRPISSKPCSCTETADVYAAGISVKVACLTLGDLGICHCATHVVRRGDGFPEVSRSRSRCRAEAGEACASGTNAEPNTLMEAALSRDNLMRAYQRVLRNKGAAGVDNMSVDALKQHLQQHWPVVRERLLAGTYQPQPIRRISRYCG